MQTMHRLRPLAPLLALLATTACNSAALPEEATKAPDLPPVTEEQRAQALLQYAQIRQMEALGKRCAWLGEIEQMAVAASWKERQAWMAWQKLDMAQAEAMANDLVKQSEGIDCKSPAGEQHRLGLGYGAWQMRSSWAMRGYSLLPSGERPAWFGGKSSVARHRPELESAVNGLKAIHASSVQASLDMFDKESVRLLAVRCTAADKDCAAMDTDAGWRAYAETILQQAEAYAAALQKVTDKTGRPPDLAATP